MFLHYLVDSQILDWFPCFLGVSTEKDCFRSMHVTWLRAHTRPCSGLFLLRQRVLLSWQRRNRANLGPGPAPGQGRECHRHCTCAIYRGRSKTTAGPCLASCQSENPEPSQKYHSKPPGPTNSQAKGRLRHIQETPNPLRAPSHPLIRQQTPLALTWLQLWLLWLHAYHGGSADTCPGEDASALTSDPGLPSKPLGTWRLQRDAPRRGHILRRGDCFA